MRRLEFLGLVGTSGPSPRLGLTISVQSRPGDKWTVPNDLAEPLDRAMVRGGTGSNSSYPQMGGSCSIQPAVNLHQPHEAAPAPNVSRGSPS
jgi:hypothetical protein